MLLSSIESEVELPGTHIYFLKGGIEWTRSNMYKNLAVWDASDERPTSIKQSASISGGVHRSKYEIQKDGTYKERAYVLQ